MINHVWQSTVFAILAAILTLAFRRNRAQVRYWLWLSASLKFLIPFSLLMSLGSYVNWTPAAKTIAAPAVTRRNRPDHAAVSRHCVVRIVLPSPCGLDASRIAGCMGLRIRDDRADTVSRLASRPCRCSGKLSFGGSRTRGRSFRTRPAGTRRGRIPAPDSAPACGYRGMPDAPAIRSCAGTRAVPCPPPRQFDLGDPHARRGSFLVSSVGVVDRREASGRTRARLR